jgi:hypothetical protein
VDFVFPVFLGESSSRSALSLLRRAMMGRTGIPDGATGPKDQLLIVIEIPRTEDVGRVTSSRRHAARIGPEQGFCPSEPDFRMGRARVGSMTSWRITCVAACEARPNAGNFRSDGSCACGSSREALVVAVMSARGPAPGPYWWHV